MNSLAPRLLLSRNVRHGVSQRGISLIETLVGMAIGLLVTLVIVQVWGVFEDQKSRTASGSSAQESGLLALTQLEQDMRSAGAGLSDSAAFDCTTIYSYYESGGTSVSPIPAYSGGMGMVPVQITDGGTGSDTLTVKRGSDFLGALPATITQPMPQSSSELNISSTVGFCDGTNCAPADTILVVDSVTGKCTVMLVTQVQQSASKIQHNPGGTTTYNPTAAFQNANAWPAYSTGAKVLKIGQLISHAYTVNSSNQLTLIDYSIPSASTTSVLAGDVVKLKAQYGIAAVGSQDVNDWVSATAATGWNVLDSAKVKRIKAVRLVVVARSAKMEAANVTSTCINNAGVNYGPCAWSDSADDKAPLIDLRSNADWQKYRYRVYQTIIPIRNVIWAGV